MPILGQVEEMKNNALSITMSLINPLSISVRPSINVEGEVERGMSFFCQSFSEPWGNKLHETSGLSERATFACPFNLQILSGNLTRLCLFSHLPLGQKCHPARKG